ncbi:MAG: flagellin modification protein A [Ignavibacteriales bacterium CG12_big_fil_rev_8_21_14_0_65_30_8]|nr:MAG: flagellin modification protein A [Ignavibacteriales bacterium CG12_big_fil_rev_8_21_14_0_65_30_8]
MKVKSNILEEKIVIIAGGLGRIGKMFTESVIENDGYVIIADILEEKYCELKNDYWREISKLDYCNLNITSKTSIQSLIKDVQDKYGKIDAFVNTTFPQTKSLGRFFENLSYEYFCESLNIHLGGYFLCAQQFALFFKTQGYGNIVNVASIQGVVAPKFDTYEGIEINGIPMTSEIDYTCNKNAIIAMTKYIAKYFRGANIRCNCISPGGILDAQPELFLNRYRNKCINKGMLDGEDLKSALLFLLSDGSKYVNGQNIIVDDGFTL